MTTTVTPTATAATAAVTTATPAVDRAAVPCPPSMFMFRLIHRGMRRDATALADVVARISEGDQPTATALRDWFVRFAAVVDQHHRIEDELLWPAVTAGQLRFEDVQLDFVDEHAAIRVAAQRVQDALDALATGSCAAADLLRARRAARTLEALMHEHIEHEELRGFPVARTVLDVERVMDIDHEARRRADPALLTFLGPWLLDHATPNEIVCIIERTPAPIVTLGRTVWRRRYERSARHVRRARSHAGTGRARPATRTNVVKAGLVGAAALAAMSLSGCGSDAAAEPISTQGATTVVATVASVVTTLPSPTSMVVTTDVPATDVPATDVPATDSMAHDHGSTVPVASDAPTSVPAPSGDPRVLDVAMSEYAFTASRTEVPAGPVTFRVSNIGLEGHQLMVGRLHDGKSVESFLAIYSAEGEKAAMDIVDWTGGLNGIAPGASGEATSELAEGDYILICFMRTSDGVPHLMLNMAAPLTVTSSDDDEPAAPVADETITVQDYTIAIPTGFRGQGTIELRNEGTEPHEVALLRLNDGKVLADAITWFSDPTTEKPFVEVGGVGVVAPGTSGWSTMHLAAGHYIALCFVPNAEGTPHAMLGMLTQFEIA